MKAVAKTIAIWALATVLGSVFAAVLAAGSFEDVKAFGPAVVVTAAHAVIFGVPAALLFYNRKWTSPWAALAGGFVIGVVPIEVYLELSDISSGVNTWSSSGPTMVNGVRTWSGWMEHIQFMAVLGGFGAGGAFAFWLTLKYFDQVERRQ